MQWTKPVQDRIQTMQRPPEIEDLSEKIKEICATKESAFNQDFEEAAEARDKEEKLQAKRERVLKNGKIT